MNHNPTKRFRLKVALSGLVALGVIGFVVLVAATPPPQEIQPIEFEVPHGKLLLKP